jgi:hypothetical protein
VIEGVLERADIVEPTSLSVVESADAGARELAAELITEFRPRNNTVNLA